DQLTSAVQMVAIPRRTPRVQAFDTPAYRNRTRAGHRHRLNPSRTSMNQVPQTIVLLIRHAHTDAVGEWLAGRSDDVPLNQVGRAQAERLRTRLTAVDVAAVYSSPMQRAIETAGPLARE